MHSKSLGEQSPFDDNRPLADTKVICGGTTAVRVEGYRGKGNRVPLQQDR